MAKANQEVQFINVPFPRGLVDKMDAYAAENLRGVYNPVTQRSRSAVVRFLVQKMLSRWKPRKARSENEPV